MELAGFSIIQPQVSAWVGRVLNLHLISTHISTWENAAFWWNIHYINAATASEYIHMVHLKMNEYCSFLVLCGGWCVSWKLKLSRIQRRGPGWHWPLSPGNKGKGWVLATKYHELLGGGFTYIFLCSPLFGEDFHFDSHIFQIGLVETTNSIEDWLFCEWGLRFYSNPILGEARDGCGGSQLRIYPNQLRSLVFNGSPFFTKMATTGPGPLI